MTTPMMLPETTPLRPRHAFGWPPGSVRAVLMILIVGLVCGLILLSTEVKPIGIPPYLLYLLFLVLGHYYAARGAQSNLAPGESPPLHLPAGSIRLLIFLALAATVGWQLVKHPDAFQKQMAVSMAELAQYPTLPLFVLGGFFLGILLRRVLIGPKPSPWWQDMEAWLCLIATFGMGIAVLVHLVIAPSMETPINMAEAEAVLGGIVAFYFGARS